jgi:hypothetical protein
MRGQNMTDTTAVVQTSALHTMLQAIETGTEILQRIMPEVAAVGGLVPGATVFIQLAGLALPAVQNAIKFIEEEEGKTPMEAFEDFLRHIGPNNGYVSPALSKAPQFTLAKDPDGSLGPGILGPALGKSAP